MDNGQTVKDLYDAFGKGDLGAIVAKCADDVDWRNDRVESRECPWNGDFSGKAKVPGFFAVLDQQMDFSVFDVQNVIAGSEGSARSTVAVQLRFEATLKKNGRTVASDSVHVWTFNDRGQIVRYRHFNDTAAELAAWRG